MACMLYYSSSLACTTRFSRLGFEFEHKTEAEHQHSKPEAIYITALK